MSRRKACLFFLGGLAGALVCRWAVRVWENARAAARPVDRPMLARASEVRELVHSLWKHPEALAMMRSNPDISAPLTDAVLAALLQHQADEEPALADRLLAWLSLRGERIHGPRVVTPSPVSRAQEALAAEFARATLLRRGRPAEEYFGALIEAFGTRTAHDLVTFVRLVTGIVLIANTWEAFVGRVLGRPSPGSRLGDELRVLSISALGVLPLAPVAFVRTLINPAG